MTVGTQSVFVDQWIRTTLSSTPDVNNPTNGRLYADLAPQDALFPLVVWNLQRADDIVGQGTFRIMTRCSYVIKVIGQTRSYFDLEPIYDAIDDALHGKGETTVNTYIFSCMRWEEIRLPEFANGKDYRHLGGLYQIEAQRITA